MRMIAVLTLLLAGCSAQPSGEPAPEPASNVTAAPPLTAPPTPTPASGGPAAASAQGEANPKLAIEAEGLRWFLQPSGSARPIPFGTPRDQVLASLERVRGPAGQGTNQDCGAGPVQYANWADGLSLVFQNGRLAGWGLDGRAAGALGTANNVGPGTTRAELDSSFANVEVRQTSLGAEFAAGGISGVLDGPGRQAKITDMWAGVNCVAR